MLQSNQAPGCPCGPYGKRFWLNPRLCQYGRGLQCSGIGNPVDRNGDDYYYECTYIRLRYRCLECFRHYSQDLGIFFILAQTKYEANRPNETSASFRYTSPSDQHNAAFLPQPEQDIIEANAYIVDVEAEKLPPHRQIKPLLSLCPLQLLPPTNDDTIKQLLQKMKDLESEVKSAKTNTGNGLGNNKKKGKNKDKKDRIYCWPHEACAHSGKDCNNPKDGHKNEAIFQNKTGGSIKDWFWLPSSTSAWRCGIVSSDSSNKRIVNKKSYVCVLSYKTVIPPSSPPSSSDIADSDATSSPRPIVPHVLINSSPLLVLVLPQLLET